MTQIVIIGGGAAGFFGAIATAEANPSHDVTLLEAARTPLEKVRISGGGRCNVTHACFEPALLIQHYPRGGKALRGAFTRFQPRDMVAWLAHHQVTLKTEADGRMFPTTDDSETIVTCLLRAAAKAQVQVRTGARVAEVTRSPDADEPFTVHLKSGACLQADRLLLATGSSHLGYAIAKSLGHTIEPPVPSLFTFTCRDPRLENLAGIAVSNVRLRLQAGTTALEQTGPLLITHWGVSGPAVLKLSAWGARLLHDQAYQADLWVNWVPDLNLEQLRQCLLTAKSSLSKRAIAHYCPLNLPRRLWERLVQAAAIGPTTRWAELSTGALNQLIDQLARGPFRIDGKGVFKEEFVTCGGVRLSEVDFKTMASRSCPGLYFAGEILDIDGVTGGFNFQSAWTTGWIAGQALSGLSPSPN